MDGYLIETREFEWKLHNFTQELLKENKIYWSENFSMFLDNSLTSWYFYIKFEGGQCGIYLHFDESEIEDFTVKFNVFLKQLNNEKYLLGHFLRTSIEFKINKSYGWNGLVPVDYICQNPYYFFKDNALILGLKVELTKIKKHEDRQANNEYQKMCIDYFETKSYCDFKLVCSDGVQIPVHRFVLAGISSVMKDIFDTKSAESTLISIKDIDGETMMEILRFIYTREVRNIKKLTLKLLYGADKYELDELKKLCVASMIKNLSVQNAIDYFILADQYDIKVLQERSAVFIKLHYKKFPKDGQNWNKLTNKFLTMLLDHYHQNPGDVYVFESTL